MHNFKDVSTNLSMGGSAHGKSKETSLLSRESAVHIQFLLPSMQDNLVVWASAEGVQGGFQAVWEPDVASKLWVGVETSRVA